MSSDEGSNGDELDLKDISGGLEMCCSDCQVMGMLYCFSTLSSFPFLFFGDFMHVIFSLLELHLLSFYHSKMFYPEAPFECYQISEVFLFSFPSGISQPHFSTPQHFNPIFIIAYVFPLDSVCLLAFPT